MTSRISSGGGIMAYAAAARIAQQQRMRSAVARNAAHIISRVLLRDARRVSRRRAVSNSVAAALSGKASSRHGISVA